MEQIQKKVGQFAYTENSIPNSAANISLVDDY